MRKQLGVSGFWGWQQLGSVISCHFLVISGDGNMAISCNILFVIWFSRPWRPWRPAHQGRFTTGPEPLRRVTTRFNTFANQSMFSPCYWMLVVYDNIYNYINYNYIYSILMILHVSWCILYDSWCILMYLVWFWTWCVCCQCCWGPGGRPSVLQSLLMTSISPEKATSPVPLQGEYVRYLRVEQTERIAWQIVV